MNYDHASERFHIAVDLLASGDEPIQKRVGRAVQELFRLRTDEVPPEILNEFQELGEQVSESGTDVVLAINSDDAKELASKIVSMFAKVERSFSHQE